MNGNMELLNFICQNAEMGKETINHILEITEDNKLKKQLESQVREYQEIDQAARKILEENQWKKEGLDMIDKIKAYLMINMQTLTNKSTSHIAEMLITGSNMGILDATKNLKQYKDADHSVKKLMERLLQFEENNVQQLKAFL